MTKLPEKFLARMRADLGADYPAFLAAAEGEPWRGFRVNTLKISPEALRPLFPFASGRVDWCGEGFYYDVRAGRHGAARAGLIYSQEPSAMIAVEELGVSPGDRTLDLCAAPGGKSGQIAAKLKGRGLLAANEVSPARAKILAENLERLGVANAVVLNMQPDALAARFPAFFDKILVDAPCSGEGMFRRDEAAVREWSPEHVRSCAQRQLKILCSAAEMLRGGGELVYSTCTFSREENEGVIARFLDTRADFELISQKRIMPHTHRGEGHFAARLRRADGPSAERPALKSADPAPYRAFEAESLRVRLEGGFAAFGDTLYLVPEGFGSLDGVRALCPGLMLGEIKKGRFEPAHALCMALKKQDFRLGVELDDAALDAWFRGETLPAPEGRGFAAALWHGFPVGWGKLVDGRLKNHLPKYLRG